MLYYVLFLCLSACNSLYPAENKLGPRDPIEQKENRVIHPDQIEIAPLFQVQLQPRCSRNKLRVLAGSCTLMGLSCFAAMGWILADPPSQCPDFSSLQHLNASQLVDVDGHSFFVEINDCGKCSYNRMICVKPLDNTQDSQQLDQRVQESMLPICGRTARYYYKIGPTYKADPFSFLQSSKNFNTFDDQRESVARLCQQKQQSIKKHDKHLAAPRHNFTHNGKSHGGRKRGS